MKRTLFIFRRDLRLEDNTGLIFALENSSEVILSFIFTPDQIRHNPFKSIRCLQFMIESLQDLEKQIALRKGKLQLFFGKPEVIVQKCITSLEIDAVIVNKDYTPYSIQRDENIQAVCEEYSVEFYAFDDLLLHPIKDTCKSDGKPYTVFTPYYRNALKVEVDRPVPNPYNNIYTETVPFAEDKQHIYQRVLPKRIQQQRGGRGQALKILQNARLFSNYSFFRDYPAQNQTTHLSAHLKFTTVSAREAYYVLALQGENSDLIRSLYWRDFFTSIAYHFPQVFKGAFKNKYTTLKWVDDKKNFKLWCEGKTGFPIVDAGMRELKETGFMHNRVRMIAASFLVKDLHINWQWGEKHFAKTLIDYDPAVNNGNWQWAASTGCDAQPYFRIFNPWSQGEKFDSDCVYIKHWIPELKFLNNKDIHSWYLEKHWVKCSLYPHPVVDHSEEAKKAIALYKNVY